MPPGSPSHGPSASSLFVRLGTSGSAPPVVLFLAHLSADAMVKITLHGNESTDWDLNKIYIKLCLEY